MKNYQQILNQVKKIVREKLENDSTGHDYWHCYRVARNALIIGKAEKADLKIIELSAWLHDIAIGRGNKDHEVKSAEIAKDLLTSLRVEKNIIEKISTTIRKHRFSKGINAGSLEEKILQDADKLDALGAIGLARVFTFAGKFNQILYDPKIKPDFDYYLKNGKSNTTINHFYDKIFKLKNLLHTKTGKKIAEQKEAHMKDFLKRFLIEW